MRLLRLALCSAVTGNLDSQLDFSSDRFLRILIAPSIIIFAALYILAISSYWKITPDSATYVMAAKSIAAGDGYRAGGKPTSLYPPVTSLIFSLCILLFPGSYLALNATVAGLTLCSVLLAFLLFKYDTDTPRASLLCLMLLGSTALFFYSTYLLSDIIYLFFSMFALVIIRRPLTKDRAWPLQTLIGIVVLAACMTRIVGLALVAAMIVTALLSRLARRATPPSSQIIVLMGVVAAVFLWEYRNMLVGDSNFKLFLQKEAWIEEAGYVSARDFVARFFQNSSRHERLASIFSNGMLEHFSLAPSYLMPLVIAFLLLGLVISMKQGAQCGADLHGGLSLGRRDISSGSGNPLFCSSLAVLVLLFVFGL